jgi:XTP/dITP diphosphohydrolase
LTDYRDTGENDQEGDAMSVLVVGSQNSGKVRELQTHLQSLNLELVPMPAELQVEETGTTFSANACLKASQVALATGQWAIADDSGLEVAALNGAPGLYSARYGDTDAERIQRLLSELGNALNRQAQFVCVIAVARPDGAIVLQSRGVCTGEILSTPQGKGGFGYDPIFYLPQLQKTFAELSATEKQQISHRGVAIRNLLPQLAQLNFAPLGQE